MTKYANYQTTLESDAKSFLDYHYEELLESVKYGGAMDYQDWVDSWDGKLHEHLDHYLSLYEAVDIIENCENEETDSGLWEGLEPKEAVKAMAFYSYKNDMYYEIKSQLQELLEEALKEAEQQKDEAKKAVEEMEEKIEQIHDIDTDQEQLDEYQEKLEVLQEKFDEVEDIHYNIEKYIDEL